MVVADEDPPRKRSRLSLKKKGDNAAPSDSPEPPPSLQSVGPVPQGLVSESEEVTDGSPPTVDLTESDLPCEGPGVPPVASMENIGNTCFFNSVLEVLRYTPCFLEGLEQLYRHIVYLEKVKTNQIIQDSEEVKTKPSLAWELVKNLFKMYKRMEKREEMFGQFANADVTSMAVKPDKVLDVIRDLNPMFEGHFQHDAQELLRCLLCYLEDSERELHHDYASILALDPALLKTPVKEPPEREKQGRNTIMEKFLLAGKTGMRHSVSALKFDDPPAEGASRPSGLPLTNDDRSRGMDCRSARPKRPSSDSNLLDLLKNNKDTKTVESTCNTASQHKRPRFRHTRLRMRRKEDGDEVDGTRILQVTIPSQSSAPSESVTPSDPSPASQSKENSITREGEGQKPTGATNIRRSARRSGGTIGGRSKVNGHGSSSPSGQTGEGTRAKQREKISPVESESSTAQYRSKKSPTDNDQLSAVKSVSNNTTRQGLKERSLTEKSETESNRTSENDFVERSPADKSQLMITTMFGRQCRRLGVRGPVLPRQEVGTSASMLPLSNLTLDSPELRRSPRKANNTRPVAVTVSPRKKEGVMDVSPSRPDEFPAFAVNENSGTEFNTTTSLNDTLPQKSMQKCRLSAQSWDTNCLESPRKQFEAKECNGIVSSAEEDLDDSGEIDFRVQGTPYELPDLVPASFEDETSDTTSLSDHVEVKKESVSAAKSSLSGVKLPGSFLTSVAQPSSTARVSVKSDNLLPSPLSLDTKRALTPGGQPSKLMVKLQNCDHLCNSNSPTISASAAMKALNAPSSTCRKMKFCSDDEEESGSCDQDSDEDEVSLGTNSSFKSVPLKSVCVKVEKCDMVCSSPEKSVSARFATSCLAKQRAQRFNTMEKLFQGIMVMRTKCLECERCTERKESFQDVSVPLKATGSTDSDSDADEEKDTGLLRLMHAFTDVERLRDDNKYYCDQCFRYVEAERSLHYETLPNILTVHLKRFSATGVFGYLSKINDHVTVPLTLKCLRDKCPNHCVRPDHRYTLFAIITHAGSTISSGHYLSYIKVRPNAVGNDTLSNYLSNSPEKKHTSEDALKQSPSTSGASKFSSPSLADSPPVGMSVNGDARQNGMCSSNDHCVSRKSDRTNSGKDHTKSLGPSCDQSGSSQDSSDNVDYHWLECDDETIRILSEMEFHGRLLEKEGALRGTPYVLFYHRLDTWRAK